MSTMMGWYGNDPGWGVWMVMALTMLGFWALVVTAVVALFRGSWRREAGPGDTGSRDQNDRPDRILDQRLARGEIDLEDYRARLSALRSGTRR